MNTEATSWVDRFATYAEWFVEISLVSFVLGLVLVPFFITRVPADYFSRPRRHPQSANSRYPLFRLALAGIKNVFGILLVMAGLVMLFTPGQGLLTLLAGLMIMNYPGKYSVERWIIQRPRVLPALNWLRTKYGKPPLQSPELDEHND